MRNAAVRRARTTGIQGIDVNGPHAPKFPDLPVELAWMKDQTGRVLSLVQSIEAAERDRLMKMLYEEIPFAET